MDRMYYKAFGNDVEIVNNFDATISYNISENASLAFQVAEFLGYIKPPLGIGIV